VIHVDNGARNAILNKGASLLPSGIVDVDGRFSIGSRVDLRDETESIFAVGLVSYASEDIQRLRGRRVSEIEDVLGYVYMSEMIHRDDLVILD